MANLTNQAIPQFTFHTLFFLTEVLKIWLKKQVMASTDCVHLMKTRHRWIGSSWKRGFPENLENCWKCWIRDAPYFYSCMSTHVSRSSWQLSTDPPWKSPCRVTVSDWMNERTCGLRLVFSAKALFSFKNFYKIKIVPISFVFDKYYPIMY